MSEKQPNRWLQDFMLMLGILCFLLSSSVAILSLSYGHYKDVITGQELECVVTGDGRGQKKEWK